ncbi:MAG: hypothetical protein VW338_08320, partial [Rhodospirillaceae bacterium]
AAIIRGPNNEITDMVSVLRAYHEGLESQIEIDYGPYRKAMLDGVRGPSVETYFFKSELLRTPVLQLRQATWLASVPKNFGLSGHFVIAYPIVADGWTHDHRVWLSKATAIMAIIFLAITFSAILVRFKRAQVI